MSSIRSTLKQTVEKTDTRRGQVFALVIQALIVISIISFSIETLPDLSERARHWLGVVEAVMVLIFTVEYLLRLYVADSKRKFVFSFFGMVDLLAILPFYLSTGLDLRTVRALRMIRLFRILKLARYSSAMRRFQQAMLSIREELIMFLVLTMILIYLASVGIYYFENDAQPEKFASIFHSIWWAVATLTTVGYGEVYPITVGGKIFTFFVLMLGLGVVAVPVGLMASALTNTMKPRSPVANTAAAPTGEVADRPPVEPINNESAAAKDVTT